MEQSVFYQLSVVLAIATGVSLIFRLFKQPLIIGYILTGFLVGPSLLNTVHNHEAFESFSQIGVALLLFIIGLGLNAAVIRSIGKPVLTTFGIITATLGPLGYGVAWLLGLTNTECLLVAIALLFSSTIIVIKSLSDKKEQTRLHGQIAIGILLVEDVVATLALLFVSAQTGMSTTPIDFLFLLAKGMAVGIGLVLTGMLIMPHFSKVFAKNQELLYLFALAWAFGVASVCQLAGFSLEVGALFAGVTLAHLPYAQAMGTRLRPLRDFFIVLFFISLGETLNVSHITAAIIPALILSLAIIVTKPLVTMASLGLLGYTKQTGFKTAVHLSQISEFSIVLIVLAQNTGLTDAHLTAVITLTAVMTIALSTYLMQYDDYLYRRLQKLLSLFERQDTKQELRELQHCPLVLLGYREGGYEFIRTFRQMKKPYVVVDYDPDVIEHLEHNHINHIYGDATDPELLDEIGVHKSELIISTLADHTENQLILTHVMRRNHQAVFVCHASSYDEAEALYEHGAAYVILPHFIGSERINEFIRHAGTTKEAFDKYRKKHLAVIGDMLLKNN